MKKGIPLMSAHTSMPIAECRIVTDSSSDMRGMGHIAFASAPLKIVTAQKEYVDDESLDVVSMVEDLQVYKGRSTTSCPNPEEWLRAFGDATCVFCITITATLSGSYNAAMNAKRLYEERYPDRHVFVMNSLSTGPEMRLIAECIEQQILSGHSFDDVCAHAAAYAEGTGLLFMLRSMKNLANNGRVHPLVAKFAGLMGIRLIGKASARGDLEPLGKCRGARASLAYLLDRLQELGYAGGRVYIAHCVNEEEATMLRAQLQERWPSATVEVYPCRALCSFYAEFGGLLVGFEKGNKANI